MDPAAAGRRYRVLQERSLDRWKTRCTVHKALQAHQSQAGKRSISKFSSALFVYLFWLTDIGARLHKRPWNIWSKRVKYTLQIAVTQSMVISHSTWVEKKTFQWSVPYLKFQPVCVFSFFCSFFKVLILIKLRLCYYINCSISETTRLLTLWGRWRSKRAHVDLSPSYL